MTSPTVDLVRKASGKLSDTITQVKADTQALVDKAASEVTPPSAPSTSAR